MKLILVGLFLTLPQGTSTQVYHVKGDRDNYTGVVGDKKVEIKTKNCLHKATDEQAGYYDLGVEGYQSIVFANSDTCKVIKFEEKK